jgi:hypothetical protein
LSCPDFLETNFEPLVLVFQYHIIITNITYARPHPLQNDAGFRPANAIHSNRVRRYKMRQMMMPQAAGGQRMIEMEGNVVQRVEGIDE